MQYGLMASELARVQLEIPEPRVGLLSVGTEIRKGSEVIRKADGLLRRAPLRYVGLVEGQDVLGGRLPGQIDVVDVQPPPVAPVPNPLVAPGAVDEDAAHLRRRQHL